MIIVLYYTNGEKNSYEMKFKLKATSINSHWHIQKKNMII